MTMQTMILLLVGLTTSARGSIASARKTSPRRQQLYDDVDRWWAEVPEEVRQHMRQMPPPHRRQPAASTASTSTHLPAPVEVESASSSSQHGIGVVLRPDASVSEPAETTPASETVQLAPIIEEQDLLAASDTEHADYEHFDWSADGAIPFPPAPEQETCCLCAGTGRFDDEVCVLCDGDPHFLADRDDAARDSSNPTPIAVGPGGAAPGGAPGGATGGSTGAAPGGATGGATGGSTGGATSVPTSPARSRLSPITTPITSPVTKPADDTPADKKKGSSRSYWWVIVVCVVAAVVACGGIYFAYVPVDAAAADSLV